MPQDRAKSKELLLKVGELGCAQAYHNLGNAYQNGSGVELDMKKAFYYYELAAMNGSVNARHNLGGIEYNSGNKVRAMKHFIMAAKAGLKFSLDMIKYGYEKGYVTKDEYANTRRAYQQQQEETTSDERNKAAILYPLVAGSR